ncbi:hypothetical protein [Xanthobacter agilis]|jgi:hypothetical protein|uniref:Uncharacterized protein n=1 Tax=Xanthobacter agilis TaxID=47492 RepID=A0ABU0L9W1_XANAG|nr:hypothetical protein [Xanthobacter agilis]MDQ0503930.1 hypothetical protein [Xanthobacter agilis]
MTIRSSLLALAVLGGSMGLACGPTFADEPSANTRITGDIRNARYCEIIPLSLTTQGLKATVYNTLGHDDCPQAQWAALSEAELRRHFEVLDILKNGPRYFIMDQIIASGATVSGELVTLGGIVLEKRAEIFPSLRQAMEPPFTEQTIDRDTTYRFAAGKPVFILTAPDGSAYVMQSYTSMVDPTLTYEDLPKLAARLALPAGWTYAMQTPETDLMLTAKGKATVIQDNLKNTYQKIVKN